MASVLTWVDILAAFKALYDLIKLDSDYSSSFLKYQRDLETYAEARRVSVIFHTSMHEIDVLMCDIEASRDRLRQGLEEDRSKSLCTIFNHIKAANGGSLPLIDDWQAMYAELGCDRNALQHSASLSSLND